MKAIAILGSGPAGLLAAHACRLRGLDFDIFSKPSKSQLGGAQYLHTNIPEITASIPETVVTYRVVGDVGTYRKKVYGESDELPHNLPVSMEKVHDGMTEHAWSLLEAYDRLWDLYAGLVEEADVTPGFIEHALSRYALVVSSVPLPLICRAKRGLVPEFHHFLSQEIAIKVGPYSGTLRDTIVYNGTWDQSWYRASNIFGVEGTEWSTVGKLPPVPDLIRDRKPLHTTCNCFPDVMRVGRRGTWMKDVLTHNAFEDMLMREVG